MTIIDIHRELDCAVPPERLWPLLADTEHLNRMIGMSTIVTEPIAGDSSARVRVRTVLDGFPVEYDEEPFEWQAPSHFRVRRVMRTGVLYSLELALALGPGPNGGSHVRWGIKLHPRFAVIVPVARVIGGWRLVKLAKATQAFDAQLAREAVTQPAGEPAAPAPATPGASLARITAALEASAPPEGRALARRLVNWVATAPDEELLHIRPFALADRWGEDRDRVLTLCLEGVVAGLFQMHWDIVCPSCRTGASRVEHLYELGAQGHCNFCEIKFDLPLDQSIEAIFQPAADVRVVVVGPFCTGGPRGTPHVVAQAHLPVDGAAHILAPPRVGPFRVFVRGGATASLAVDADGDAEAIFEVRGDTLTPTTARLAPNAPITVRQLGGSARHVKLEQVAWTDQAATAHRLSLHPRFRRLFSGEVLGPGRQLRVARVALLFSDLSASTALYSRVGDASAFRFVQDHFELIRACITTEGGVIVKTIGDAVMAAFPEEGAALRASVAMQAAWGGFRAGQEHAGDTRLKLGVYAGPAYVVTANGVLDYFGQTVNVAARLQGAAHEGEIVVSDVLAGQAESAGWLGPARVTERFDAVLKGLEQPLRSARLVIPVGEG